MTIHIGMHTTTCAHQHLGAPFSLAFGHIIHSTMHFMNFDHLLITLIGVDHTGGVAHCGLSQTVERHLARNN